MRSFNRCLMSSLWLLAGAAFAQSPAVLADLDAAGRTTLSKAELDELLPNAKMSRVTAAGNAHYWKNEPGGSFIISSDNRSTATSNSTAPGKWHISEDGRYCLLVEWKTVATEEWCRYIVKAGNDHYATRSVKTGTERVFKLSITK
jgi:hypothetical protein